MSTLKPRSQRIIIWRLVGIVALVAVILLGSLLLLQKLNPEFIAIFSNREQFQSYVNSYGARAPLMYILLQAFQVVVAPIPGEFTGSIAGALFGTATGFFYASLGLALGSLIAFGLGRIFGQRIVHWMVPAAERQRFAAISSRKQRLLVFIIFFIPGLPKDSLTYLFAVGEIRYWQFFFVSQLARMPGTLLLTATGSALALGNWTLLASLAAVAVAGAAVAYRYRSAILIWLKG